MLIPDTTSAVCACYIFTGNSDERQRQTQIAEVTCRERPTSVCFAWECELLQITRNQCELNCQWLHLLSSESSRALGRRWKNPHKPRTSSHSSSYTDLHVISCNITWRCGHDKTLTGGHLFATAAFFFFFYPENQGEKSTSCSLCRMSIMMLSNLKF